jgi:thioredoxin-like negative regulator of GroEL
MPVQGAPGRSNASGRTAQRGTAGAQRIIVRPAPAGSARVAASEESLTPSQPQTAPQQVEQYRTAELPSPPRELPQDQPAQTTAPEVAQEAETPAKSPSQITWQTDLHAAHKIAVETGRPMMIVFGAEWCHYCKQLEKETLSQPQLAEYINANFVPVHMDMDRPQDKEVANILEVKPIPCTVILSPNADRVQDKILGYREAPQFYQALETARYKGAQVRQTRFSRLLGR